MGKAYNFGQTVRPKYYTPDGADAAFPWVLADATPASCVQLGVYHLFQERGPVDLVISGPNYGHNLTSVYNLASGTVGGAMEAALCGKKAIALSWAFGNHQAPGDDGVHGAELIAAASRISVDLIENLVREWCENVEVYHINVPPLRSAQPPDAVWTTAARSSLSSSSIFRPLANAGTAAPSSSSLQAFQWAPNFTDVRRTLEDGPPGTDAWALREGYIGWVAQTWLSQTVRLTQPKHHSSPGVPARNARPARKSSFQLIAKSSHSGVAGYTFSNCCAFQKLVLEAARSRYSLDRLSKFFILGHYPSSRRDEWPCYSLSICYIPEYIPSL
jgi:5'/3'-nucleotidase SurE